MLIKHNKYYIRLEVLLALNIFTDNNTPVIDIPNLIIALNFYLDKHTRIYSLEWYNNTSKYGSKYVTARIYNKKKGVSV